MGKEQRMFGDYFVRAEMRIGKYEIVVCESDKVPAEEKYLCAYVESNGIFERCTECMVSDSYADIVTLYGERITQKAEEMQKIIEKEGKIAGDDSEIVAEQCIPITEEDNLEDKVIVIRGNVLPPEYRRATHQIMLCTGGSGAMPMSRGRTCFCKSLLDSHDTRFYRQDVLGILDENRMPEWAKSKLHRMEQQSEIKKSEDKCR